MEQSKLRLTFPDGGSLDIRATKDNELLISQWRPDDGFLRLENWNGGMVSVNLNKVEVICKVPAEMVR